tara:strand:+ start:711 stop:983 length:273 start_codon:yes stop_codon:yes gene_type:complete
LRSDYFKLTSELVLQDGTGTIGGRVWKEGQDEDNYSSEQKYQWQRVVRILFLIVVGYEGFVADVLFLRRGRRLILFCSSVEHNLPTGNIC